MWPVLVPLYPGAMSETTNKQGGRKEGKKKELSIIVISIGLGKRNVRIIIKKRARQG